MTLPVTPPPEVTPAPFSAEQLARHKALRRFNWWALYLPITLVTLLAVTALVWLTVLSFSGTPNQPRTLAGGTADFWLITSLLCPATLVCGLLPAGGVALLVQRRRRGSWLRAPIQRGAARVVNLLDTAQTRVADVQPLIARPFVVAHGRLAFVKRLAQQLIHVFKRS